MASYIFDSNPILFDDWFNPIYINTACTHWGSFPWQIQDQWCIKDFPDGKRGRGVKPKTERQPIMWPILPKKEIWVGGTSPAPSPDLPMRIVSYCCFILGPMLFIPKFPKKYYNGTRGWDFVVLYFNMSHFNFIRLFSGLDKICMRFIERSTAFV